MGAVQFLRYAHRAYLSKPAHERLLFRLIHRWKVRAIVEFGLGSGRRAARMIEVAGWFSGRGAIRYAGLDWFEARPDSQLGISLKAAHRMLAPLGARVRLIPGDPNSSLSRWANALLGTDLLVIRDDCLAGAAEPFWFYVPRMLHSRSLVLHETIVNHRGTPRASFTLLAGSDIQRWAGAHVPYRKAA